MSMKFEQSARLASMNDQWGVARWDFRATHSVGVNCEVGEVYVWMDDGDEAVVHEDGTATWKSGAYQDQEVTP